MTSGRPAVFLDRDGTIIEDPGYLSDRTGVRLIAGAADSLVEFGRAGYLRVVITNQSGIGRGRYDRAAFDATQRETERLLAEVGAAIDAVYVCPHRPDAGCVCRKPRTALHREAMATLGIDPAKSWCIGDQLRDVEPARELGCRALLVRTGDGGEHAAAAEAIGVPVVTDLVAGLSHLRSYI